MKVLVRLGVVALVLTLGCATAHAAPISFQYSGLVNSVQFNATYGGSAPAQVGDRLVFTYTFQSDAAPSPVFPWRTWYSGQGPLQAELYRAGARIGSWVVPLIDITLVDNFATFVQGFPGYDDRYEVQGRVPDAGAADPLPFEVSAYLGLVDHEFVGLPNALQGTALPLVPPDPRSFDFPRYLALSRLAEVPLGGGVSERFQHWYFSALIDSVQAVSEPGTLLLLGAGLLAARRRRRCVRTPRGGTRAG